MEIKSRKTAVAAGDNKYFTGRPCKNGHTAPRYTVSGVCVQCLYASNREFRDSMPAIDMRERRNEAIRELVVFGVRCYTSDVETVRGTVEALTKARFPFLTMKEIEYKHATSHSGGTALFHFRVHPLDIDFVRAVADELMNAHDPNFDRTRAKLQRIVEEKTSRPEPPEWKP